MNVIFPGLVSYEGTIGNNMVTRQFPSTGASQSHVGRVIRVYSTEIKSSSCDFFFNVFHQQILIKLSTNTF